MEEKATKKKNPLETERRKLIKITKELCYGKKIIEKLKSAKTESELIRIMRVARLSKEHIIFN